MGRSRLQIISEEVAVVGSHLVAKPSTLQPVWTSASRAAPFLPEVLLSDSSFSNTSLGRAPDILPLVGPGPCAPETQTGLFGHLTVRHQRVDNTTPTETSLPYSLPAPICVGDVSEQPEEVEPSSVKVG